MTTDQEDNEKVKKVVDLKKRVEERRAKEAEEYGSETGDGGGGLSSTFVRQCLNANELGDGILYAHIHRDKFIFCQNMDHYLVWTGSHWEIDVMERAHYAVEDVCNVYLDEVTRIYDLAAKKNIDPDGELIKNLYKRVRRLRSAAGRKTCIDFAHRCAEPISIRGDELDTRPMLLSCPNGVVDLETGKFGPGCQKDFLLKTTNAPWTDINDKCEIWDNSLLEVFSGNIDLVEYIQRLFGYAITGLDVEHIFPVLHGHGRNGKTMIVETISQVMGDLAAPIQSEMLLDQGRSRGTAGPSPDIMGLKGLRMAFASETDQGRRVSPSRVKWLTGGDALKGRNPHDKYETSFKPTHTLFLLTNNKPHAPAEDFAFWERVHLLPFQISFVDRDPEEENERRRDRDLPAKLREESSGILSWLVRGCLQWQKEGLNPPPIVKQATAEYKRDEDLLADFVDECCMVGPEFEVTARDLYKEFVEWWKEAIGRNAPAQKTFGRLAGKRFEKAKRGGVYRYYGIALAQHM